MITNNKKYAILVHSELRQFELANQSWKFKDILDRYIEESETELDKSIIQNLIREIYQEACEMT